MAFQRIYGVDIGQGSGNAFGGGIYAASCEIGFSNSPTKISLNVVSENGIYQSISPNVYSTPYNINLNGKTFSGMYLYAYEKSKNPDAALLTLNFIDSSIILDKVFVGLLNRHGNKNKTTTLETATFTVRCPSCTDGLITGVSGYARRYLDNIPGGQYYEKSTDGGGYIILGKENFADSNCETPRVDYNFTELCQAISAYGIKHELTSFDLNNLYRQEYVGTIREVLNSWASDFCFEFFYDGDTLKAIDLRKPISLNSIQSFAENNQNVITMDYSETLENTFTQSVVARYLKPSTPAEYNNTYYSKNLATQITLNDILLNGKCAYRNGDMLLYCVALAKFDSALREAYIANYAVNNNYTPVLEALGMKYVLGTPYKVDGATKQLLMFYVTNIKNTTTSTNFIVGEAINPDNYEVYFGIYRDKVKQEVEQWDQEAADFLGKYYYFNGTLPQNRFDCPYYTDGFMYYTYNSEWSTIPQSNTYGADSVPFASLLRDPVSSVNLTNFIAKNIFSVEDNVWGTTIDIYKAAKGSNDYEGFRPMFIPFSENPEAGEMTLAKLRQEALASSANSTIDTIMQKNATENGGEVGFLIVPLLHKFSNAPKISIAGTTINSSVYNRMVSNISYDEQASRCLTYCDINIVDEICNCGTKYTPTPYFQSLLAPYFQVGHYGGYPSNIIFPVTAGYWGYFKHDRYYKTTNPPIKSIYGTPPVTANNTLGVKVVDYDITPDMDAIVDNSNAVNQYIYSPTNGTVMTAQAYYDELANLNNVVIPPQKTVSFAVARTDVDKLGISLSPVNGLISMSVSLSQTRLTYATRPPVIPKPDVFLSKVKYRLRQ